MYASVSENTPMTARQHPPVILFLGERTCGMDSVDRWLAESRYSALEATDVFQALEQISDFTQAERPDVVFLHCDPASDDIAFMQTLVTTAADQPDVPIIDFAVGSNTKGVEDFEKALAGLACRLDEYIPAHGVAKA